MESAARWRIAILLVISTVVVPLSAPQATSPVSAGAAQDAPALSARPDTSSDGVYQLQWQGGLGVIVIEESPTADFASPIVLYRGRDRATVVTGRPDGVYHYRMRGDDGHSAPLAGTVVRVQHHPLSRAVGFFLAGLFVFVATVWLVLRGPDDGAPVMDRTSS